MKSCHTSPSSQTKPLSFISGASSRSCRSWNPFIWMSSEYPMERGWYSASLFIQQLRTMQNVSMSDSLCSSLFLHSILSTLRSLAAKDIGSPILYELIEKGKEMLTDSNFPRGHCAICLYDFQEGDFLTKTLCYHHFHSHCLGQYCDHCLKSSNELKPLILCPVCRENLSCDILKLNAAPPPQHAEIVYVPDAVALHKRNELRQIYEKQLLKGGIIDPETEKKRFFISIQDVPGNDHLVPQTEEPTSLQPEEDPVLPVQDKPQHPTGSSVQTSGVRGRPPHGEPSDVRHLQSGREWIRQNRSRSEENPSQNLPRTIGREETRLSRNQVGSVSERFKHRGTRTFRSPHPNNWKYNV
uniref:RING-type domain-containing protein n=1 Tax=Leptobrachium leishanense TaxID=445787 RepID=A0A8C5Q8U1_9ANUR